MSETQIKKIVFDIDGKEIELNLSQAKKLWENLDEIFGAKTVFPPSYPIIIERPPTPWTYPIITYHDHSQPSWISGTTGTPMHIDDGSLCMDISNLGE